MKYCGKCGVALVFQPLIWYKETYYCWECYTAKRHEEKQERKRKGGLKQ